MERRELACAIVHLAEGVLRLLDLLLQPHFAILHAAAPLEVEHVVHALQEHRDALEAVGDLAGDRGEVDAADLLEVGELRDLQAVEHHLPADAPGAQRRRLPVVLFEPDVVLPRVDAARLEAVEIQLLHFVGRRLEDHLILVVLEQPVRVLAEPAVVGPPRRLHVGDAPRLRPEHAEERLRVRGAGAHFEIERLLQQAAVRGPERRQLEDEVLKGHAILNPVRSLRVTPKVAKHAVRFQRLLQMHRDQRAMHGLQLPKHLRAGRHAANLLRRHRSRSRQKRHRRVRQRASRLRIHALQPQQPVLEVARQRLHRCAGAPARRASTRPADRAARRRRRPAPTRRAARRSSSHIPGRPSRVRRGRLQAALPTPTATEPSPRSSARPAPAARSRSTPPALR